MKIKYQTKSVTVTNGTGSGTKGQFSSIALDSEYDRCIGIRVIETGSTAQSYRLSLLAGAQGATNLIDLVHKDLWLSTTGIKPEDRPIPVDIPAKGNSYVIGYDIITTLSAELALDIVFILVKD